MNFLKKILSKTSVKKSGTVLIVATGISNFFNLLFNAYLGRTVRIEDFAVITLFISILSISDIPIGSLGRSITYKSAFLLGRYQAPATVFWQSVRKRAILASFALTIIWVFSSVFLAGFFRLGNAIPILAFAPIWFLVIVSSIDAGYLNGNLNFSYLGFVFAIESMVKFLFALILVYFGFGHYSYLAIIFSSVISFSLIVTKAKSIHAKKIKFSKKLHKFPSRFYWSNVISKISTVVYISSDVILAKHFLPANQAGQYALLSLAGKMVFFAGSLFSQFILPMTSHKGGSGKNTSALFYKLLVATFLASLLAFTVIGIFGKVTMPFIFGDKAKGIINYLLLYSLSMLAFTLSTSIVTYNQVKEKHLIPVLSFVIAIIQIVTICLFNSSIQEIATTVSTLGFVSLILVGFFHFCGDFVTTIGVNAKDFFEVFLPSRRISQKEGLRILIFNWRDTKHMWAGGAEVYVHELAKRWVKKGNSVTLFCGNDRRNLRNETIDGIQIIRRGGFYTVYVWAILYYLIKFRSNYDVIVDSENGIPFFSPLFSSRCIILLIHHVHQDIFVSHMKPPLSYIGRFIEGKLMPVIYRGRTVVTVSQSTKAEIIKSKIAEEENIQIVNPGIDIPQKLFRKTINPTIIYLGRLKSYKNIDIAVKAYAVVEKKVPKSRFWIVGEGEEYDKLKKLVKELGVEKKVSFYGKVDNEKKLKLLSRSWVAVQPSSVEGWGITVIEANACKTPVVASDTNGLRDSVVNNRTGKLVKVRSIKGFAKGFSQYITNSAMRTQNSNEAYLWANKFSWEKSADTFFQLAYSEVVKKRKTLYLQSATNILNRISSLF